MALLTELLRRFYAELRCDPVLGPIFAARVTDWPAHLERMVAFWSSAAAMTGRHHGAPVPKHAGLPVHEAHFARWLRLFRETANETCAPAGAARLRQRATRIAWSLHIAASGAAIDSGDAGCPVQPPRPTTAVTETGAQPVRED